MPLAYFDFHLIRLDAIWTVWTLLIITITAWNKVCCCTSLFWCCWSWCCWPDVLIHVALGVTTEPLLHMLLFMSLVMLFTLLFMFALFWRCCWDLSSFSTCSRISQVTVKYKHYLTELAQLRRYSHLAKLTTANSTSIYSIAAAAFCAERDWSTVCVEQISFLTMHKDLPLFELLCYRLTCLVCFFLSWSIIWAVACACPWSASSKCHSDNLALSHLNELLQYVHS